MFSLINLENIVKFVLIDLSLKQQIVMNATDIIRLIALYIIFSNILLNFILDLIGL